jgi:hypothetical protein
MIKKVGGTYSDVVVNSLSPAVQVNQSVQGGQLTPAHRHGKNQRERTTKKKKQSEQLKKREQQRECREDRNHR